MLVKSLFSTSRSTALVRSISPSTFLGGMALCRLRNISSQRCIKVFRSASRSSVALPSALVRMMMPKFFGLDGLHQVLEALALGLVGEAAADADLVDEGHQHHVAPGKGDLRREARALGADGLLGDLHQDALAGAEHIGQFAVLGDVRFQLPTFQQARSSRVPLTAPLANL